MSDTLDDLFAQAKERLNCRDYLERRGARFEPHGKFLRCRCPFPDHSDTTPSFDVFRDAGRFEKWVCRGCDRHGDIVDLVMALEGRGKMDALRSIIGSETASAPIPKAATSRKRKEHRPVPHQRVEPPMPGDVLKVFHDIGEKAPKVWDTTPLTRSAEVIDYDGVVVGYEVRYPMRDHPEKKLFAFVAWDGKHWWQTKPAAPHPLYQGAMIPKDATVVVLEGTKKPDIFNDLGLAGYHAVGYYFGGKAWRDFDWSPLQGHRVLLLPDYKGQGEATFHDLAEHLRSIGIETDTVKPIRDLGDNIDDYIANHGWDAERVRQHIEGNRKSQRNVPSISPDAWRNDQRLVRKDDGQPNLKSPLNAAIVLEQHPLFREAFQLNRMSGALEWTRAVKGIPRSAPYVQLEEADFFAVSMVLEEETRILLDHGKLIRIMETVAERMGWVYHPVRDYLRSLHWDGEQRLEHWLEVYAQAEPDRIYRAYAAKWMIAAVARVMDPGCKVDAMLVLEGEQGLRKSSLLQALARIHPVHDVYLPNLQAEDQEAATRCEGKWIVEIAELDGLHRGGETSRFKAFTSTQVDKIRRPYARTFETIQRQFILAGTVNPDGAGYLKDPTGNRRFWPVPIGEIDLDALRRDKDVLWAEAFARWSKGEQWWLTADEEMLAKVVVQEREQTDPWEELIRERLKGEQRITVSQVMTDPLGIMNDKRSKSDQMRVAQILHKIGFRKRRAHGQTVWYRVISD